MKILMLGWELPPKISGGLGVASDTTARALVKAGHTVHFLLPKKLSVHRSDVYEIFDLSDLERDQVTVISKVIREEVMNSAPQIATHLIGYISPHVFQEAKENCETIEIVEEVKREVINEVKLSGEYLETLESEVAKFALLATEFAEGKNYDLVHAHDWMTYAAGQMIASKLEIPFYAHCHSTEYDRNGDHAQQRIVKYEQNGFTAAQKVICVSDRLKVSILNDYRVHGAKLEVVPNAFDGQIIPPNEKATKIEAKYKVLFIGRLTAQKNPEAFVDLARTLLNQGLDCSFQVLGDGYLMDALQNRVKQNNLWNHFEFKGFVGHSEVMNYLSEADLLIVPSHNEPFGLVMLEAIAAGVPVVASSIVGVTDYVPVPALPAWDHFRFANLCVRLLKDAAYAQEVVDSCQLEMAKLNLDLTASQLIKIYQ